MSNKLVNFGAAAAMAMTALVPATPVMAHERYGNERYENGDGYYRDRGYDNGGYYSRRGFNRGASYDDRDSYRDRNYRYRGQRCGKGSTGLILGAVAGGLLGRAVVGYRGDRTAGAIVGAGVGALAGRAIDKGDDRGC